MEQGLQVFAFEGRSNIRVVMKDGDPWFVAKDVCDVLGLSNSRKAVRALDDEDKSTVTKSYGTSPKGGNPNMTIISESGLYTLIFRSNKPEAEVFSRWVTREVLPSIRKIGAYSLRPTLSPEELALKQEELALNKAKFLTDLIEKYKVHLSSTAIESMVSYSANIVAGFEIVPLPRTEKHYTATQIGKMLGISRNQVCRVANLFGLKTEQNGQWVLDKADNCDKQVEVFRYNQAGVDAVKEAYMRWQQDDEDED